MKPHIAVKHSLKRGPIVLGSGDGVGTRHHWLLLVKAAFSLPLRSLSRAAAGGTDRRHQAVPRSRIRVGSQIVLLP